MRKLLFLSFIAAAVFCSSCSEDKIKMLEAAIAKQNSHIERLGLMLAERDSQITEMAQELEARVKAAEKATAAIKTLTDENTKLKVSLDEVREKAETAATWLKSLPGGKRKIAEGYQIKPDTPTAKALDTMFMVMQGRDRQIEALRIENAYFIEKFQEIMAQKNNYEYVIATMNKDGIDTEKYLKLIK